MNRLMPYFDLLLHRKMETFDTFSLQGKVYAWLHYCVHEIAFLLRSSQS